ncbi:hypothetical protein FB451DRAFT_1374823 [Mycena latifolia]|nr:hypothetical protein FB451DRAFT_1374823 [Mycena latifolia]
MTTMLTPSNAIPHSQRLRLIRSIRKLGDLLTESALLVEPASPSPASPISPLRRNFLSLRLSAPNAARDATSTPLSATFSTLNSPATPVIDVAALNERKLAKVAQTLGENVPPELVLAPSAPTHTRRKRASTVSVPEPRTVIARRRPAPVHAHTPSRALKHAASSTSLRPEWEGEPFSGPSLIPVPSYSPSLASTSSLELDTPPTAPTSRARAGKGPSMHRKEAGWSGEWSGSVRNMDDVVRGLRGLRLK